MSLSEREARTRGYCTVELFFRKKPYMNCMQYPPVRTEQAQSISYLLRGKNNSSVFLKDNKKNLGPPHSQTLQT